GQALEAHDHDRAPRGPRRRPERGEEAPQGVRERRCRQGRRAPGGGQGRRRPGRGVDRALGEGPRRRTRSRPAMRALLLARAAAVLAVGAGVALSLGLIAVARHRNGFDGFPLDDPWIHLTFARTLREHGAFAYFPGETARAGSTSPLYTLLLAAGFLVTDHEKWIAYALGIFAQAGFLLLAFDWARRRLASPAAAAATVLLLGCAARLALLSASGMETSLFLLTIAAAFAARLRGRGTTCAVALGLATWVRPEGLILAGVFALDSLLSRRLEPRAPAVFGAIVLAYVLFNLATGGHLLPTTFAAKTAYYGGLPRVSFLERDVFGLVT